MAPRAQEVDIKGLRRWVQGEQGVERGSRGGYRASRGLKGAQKVVAGQ